MLGSVCSKGQSQPRRVDHLKPGGQTYSLACRTIAFSLLVVAVFRQQHRTVAGWQCQGHTAVWSHVWWQGAAFRQWHRASGLLPIACVHGATCPRLQLCTTAAMWHCAAACPPGPCCCPVLDPHYCLNVAPWIQPRKNPCSPDLTQGPGGA